MIRSSRPERLSGGSKPHPKSQKESELGLIGEEELLPIQMTMAIIKLLSSARLCERGTTFDN